MFELFSIPFMQKALIAGAILALILPYLGVFVTMRRMSFFGDGVAHASLLGVAIALMAGWVPLFAAIPVALLFGALMYVLERTSIASADAIIGMLFTTALALGVIIMSTMPGYQPELLALLFGNILALSFLDVLLIALVGFGVLIFLTRYVRDLTLLSFDRDSAWLSGVSVNKLDLAFYLVLSFAVVIGVKLLGIILVSALLIIPATTAKVLAHSFVEQIELAILAGQLAVFIGLVLSYFLDYPSGATIVVVSMLLFILAQLLHLGVRKAI